MLEKIGLPPKPSMRGSNWVVDASHCQGCSSQFTFINRKHHCRRCGGLFCNSCTQQRMYLRGQGDSPVRICDPCKKLEEAARFELRHGHKNRTSKGGSKLTAKYEDEVLNQILGTDIKQSSLAGSEASISNVFSDIEKGTTSASSSSFNVEAVLPVDRQDGATKEIGSCSPEELYQLSLEEKKKYKVLKGEGKPEEALRAFKRGKEFERQAKALEVTLRKNNRKALSSNSLAGKMNEDSEGVLLKNASSSHTEKEKKNDLASELRELGWSDADLHDADMKPPKTSLEGELSSLIGEVHKSSGMSKGPGSIDKSEVIVLKKKALKLKREGKLAEAKEELKKAKVLEQQLEEQEFLAGAEDSDDELSSLIRSMDNGKQDEISLFDGHDAGFDFNHLVGVSDDLGLDGNFEVTEQDMEDPDIVAALESLGWTDDSEPPATPASLSVPVDGKALQDDILALKKEAVRQKRSGNVEEAMVLLRKAKLLERDAESLQSQGNIMASNPSNEKVPTSQTAGSLPSRNVGDVMGGTSAYVEPKSQPKSKLMIQRELLGLKKRALTLKREGRLNEAEEELRKGKVLESQLEEMESGPRVRAATARAGNNVSEPVQKQLGISEVVGLGEEEDEGDVTEQDMQDPTMLEMLEDLGWKDEDMVSEFSSRHSNAPLQPTTEVVKVPKRSKAEIQRELLGLKRKALTLRRQGEAEEADEVLRKAKLLETQMEEIEVSKKEAQPNSGTNTQEVLETAYSFLERKPDRLSPESLLVDAPHQDEHQSLFSHLENLGGKPEAFGSTNITSKPSEQSAESEHVVDRSKIHAPLEKPTVALRSKAEIERELLMLKRKALNLRRQGESEESEEVLKKAKVLEAQLEMIAPKKETLLDPMDTEPGAGASISKEEPGHMMAVEKVKTNASESLLSSKNGVPNLATGSHWTNNSIVILPSSPIISTRMTSQCIDDKTSLLELDSAAEKKVVEHAGSFPQSVNVTDLLTGDGWQSSQKPVEVESKVSSSSKILPLDNTYDKSGTSKRPDKVMGSKDEFLSKIGEESVARVEKASVHETNSTPLFNSQGSPSEIRQEILALKRKAVALKREGRLAEAREELRQAKLLEKSLTGDNPSPDTGSREASVSTSKDTSVLQEEHKTTEQAPKAVTGRDRFKLQQESLAHKRQALKLRREGRTAEADAEFELAKALEAQLEESSGSNSAQSNKSVNETGGMDDLGVEDLLDPQLLSALKAIGIQGAEMVQQAPKRVEPTKAEVVQQAPKRVDNTKPNLSKNDNMSSPEKSQLEERIRAEKVKAVNLKKAGKQAEALDALRRAKMYEKKLNTLA